MQLRSSTRLPARYREDEIADLSAQVAGPHRTVPYNPDLPPAAFPTLDYPRPVKDRVGEVMVEPGLPEFQESSSRQDIKEKRATVFHGIEVVGHPESNPNEPEAVNEQGENITEPEGPSEYDGWGVMTNDDLSAYEMVKMWSQVTDGLKLVIVMELTDTYSFEEAMIQLRLTEEEQDELVDLSERERARQAAEDGEIARSQARQLEMLMSGRNEMSRETISSSFEDLYTDVEDPPMFMIKKSDIEHAQRFLLSIHLKDYANCLWRYEGVAQSSLTMNLSGFKTNGTSNILEPKITNDKQQNLRSFENEETSLKNDRKRDSETMLETEETLPPVKKRRVEMTPSGTKLLSRLRISITADDLEERVAMGPPALQIGSPPSKLPAQPTRQHSKEKHPVSPQIKFVKKVTQSSVPTTPTRDCSGPAVATPGSLIARREKHSWLASRIEQHSPTSPSSKNISSSPSTPSRAPVARMTPPQIGFGQMDEVLGGQIDVIAKAITPKDGKPVASQKRKRGHESDNDVDP